MDKFKYITVEFGIKYVIVKLIKEYGLGFMFDGEHDIWSTEDGRMWSRNKKDPKESQYITEITDEQIELFHAFKLLIDKCPEV